MLDRYHFELADRPRRHSEHTARVAVIRLAFQDDIKLVSLPRAAWLLDITYTQVTPKRRYRAFHLISPLSAADLLSTHVDNTAYFAGGGFQIDGSGFCEAPYHSHLKAVPSALQTRFRRSGELIITTDLSTGMPVKVRKTVLELVDMHFYDKAVSIFYYSRCRKCPDCLRARRRQWMRRISLRLAQARRTWFVTFTLGPSARAIVRVHKKELGKEVTRYLKRLRKKLGKRATFKYVVAFELHKDGTPHVHLLIHEMDNAITRREIEAPWYWGRVKNAKLVIVSERMKALRYVAKYLLKSSDGRVRASLHY